MKNCAQCQSLFEVRPEDRAFYDKISPVVGGKKYPLPDPTFCPDCRAQRRQAWLNQNHLYRRNCDASGDPIISIFSPDKKLKVYKKDLWWGDSWDPLSYGRDFDFSRPFFEQFDELARDVPMMSLLVDGNQNSEYVNYAGWDKNCYLCYCADYDEDCMYLQQVYYSKDTVDCLYSYHMELCYGCTDCKDSYRLFYSQNSGNCRDSWFLFDCVNCSDCFGSFGLRGKQYHFFNEQLSREAYEARLEQFLKSGYKERREMAKKVTAHFSRYPRRHLTGLNNENIYGDYLFNSRNAYHCFDSIDLEDASYCFNVKGGRDAYDVNHWGYMSELLYEIAGAGNRSQRLLFCSLVWNNCSDLLYCMSCVNSVQNCFGCVGLRQKQYCILNKQYTKEAYEALVPKIIEHMKRTGATRPGRGQEWGEFFPASQSFFGYNETQAQDYYPLSKEEAPEKGFLWSDYEAPAPKAEKTIPADRLPDRLEDEPDDILNRAIECEVTGTPFRLIRKELDFYRQNKLPLPRRCPEQRHADRMVLRNPRKLFNRKCDKCGTDIKTTYSPDRPEKVYCEACYLKEVY